MRKLPNIIITGTPGVGKTTHATLLTSQLASLRHLEISRVARERGCTDGHDSQRNTAIVDEDLLLDALEAEMKEGGCVVDWHACDLFPESWVDLVVVVRCESDVLFPRLDARGYDSAKIGENLDAEIMQVLLEEARAAFDEAVVVEVRGDKAVDVEANVDRLIEWVGNWKKDHGVEDDDDDEEEEEEEEEEEDEDRNGEKRPAEEKVP